MLSTREQYYKTKVILWENEYYSRVFGWLLFGMFIGFVIGYISN